MIIENGFNSDDLFKCSFQYQIRHHLTSNFYLGDNVFLKSNPEVELIVSEIKEKEIICFLKNNVNEKYDFIPECILQYKYASLLIYNDKYKICIN